MPDRLYIPIYGIDYEDSVPLVRDPDGDPLPTFLASEGEPAITCATREEAEAVAKEAIANTSSGGITPLVWEIEVPALTQPGDTLQSAASRLAEWVLEQTTDRNVPYEVHMAALEAETAADQWTEARRA